jgi:hypothetical protein
MDNFRVSISEWPQAMLSALQLAALMFRNGLSGCSALWNFIESFRHAVSQKLEAEGAEEQEAKTHASNTAADIELKNFIISDLVKNKNSHCGRGQQNSFQQFILHRVK